MLQYLKDYQKSITLIKAGRLKLEWNVVRRPGYMLGHVRASLGRVAVLSGPPGTPTFNLLVNNQQ